MKKKYLEDLERFGGFLGVADWKRVSCGTDVLMSR